MSVKKVLCVISVCVCVKASVLSGKGLYCKDPDVGSYHPVNSTWSSTTFCGNYTCKIRKKSSIVTVDILPEVLNITDISKDETDLDQSHTAMDLDQSHAGSETHITIAERPATGRTILNRSILANVHDPEARRQLLKNIQDKIFISLSDKEDRYLTDDEISTITKLLKVVKKSDLEALFEIYTLAKDIFKEIDATSESHSSIDKSKTDNSKESSNTKSAISRTGAYFYDSIINQWVNVSGPELKNITPVPTYESPLIKGLYYKKRYTSKDSTNQQITPRNSTCPFHTPEVPYHWIKQQPEPRVPPLPLPFSYLYQNDAFYPYPDVTYTKPVLVKTFDIPGNVITTPEFKPDHNQKPIQKANNGKNSTLLHKILGASNVDVFSQPQWKTQELSPEAIEDVRANVLQKSQKRYNFFPMRRKVYVERVGKVMKVDSGETELTRLKRENKKDSEDPGEDEYEVFIEKISCDANLELGFFRVGNQSLPYPACCPVKID